MKFESKGDFPKYIPIGETFFFEGKKYKCIQGNDMCSTNDDLMQVCSFHPIEHGNCEIPRYCTPCSRKDKNEVIFRLIE